MSWCVASPIINVCGNWRRSCIEVLRELVFTNWHWNRVVSQVFLIILNAFRLLRRILTGWKRRQPYCDLVPIFALSQLVFLDLNFLLELLIIVLLFLLLLFLLPSFPLEEAFRWSLGFQCSQCLRHERFFTLPHVLDWASYRSNTVVLLSKGMTRLARLRELNDILFVYKR
jgi:hypothetical protein